MARWIEVWGFGEAGWTMTTSPLTTFLGYPGMAGMFVLDIQWRNRDGLFWSRGLLDRGHCLPRCCVYDYEYDERSRKTNKDSQRRVVTGSYVRRRHASAVQTPRFPGPWCRLSLLMNGAKDRGTAPVACCSRPARRRTVLDCPVPWARPVKHHCHASVPESHQAPSSHLDLSGASSSQSPRPPNLFANVASGILPWCAAPYRVRGWCFSVLLF
jgi:hypothetical protein